MVDAVVGVGSATARPTEDASARSEAKCLIARGTSAWPDLEDEAAINGGTDPRLPLFAAAQDVLTELRLTGEQDQD
jgi:hypothetical protein